MLTHDPKLDDAALVLALRSNAAYIGAMGSRRAQEKRRERLLAKGIDDAELARIAAPIGLDLGALTAEETALSIMGEIVAMRNTAPAAGRRARAATSCRAACANCARARSTSAARSIRPAGRALSGEAMAPAGIVLAAGAGRRFGGAKQLASCDGRPLLAYAVEAMLAVPALRPA